MTKDELIKMVSNEESPLKKQKLQDLLDKMYFFEKEEQPLVNDLKSIGISVESVWDLVNNRSHPHLKNGFVGKYEIAYSMLVKHLDYDYHPSVKEGIIRALTEKNAAKVAKDKILDLFNNETDKNLKWVLANCLKTLMTWKQREKYPDIKATLKGK
jgi:hypothetical protein